jgi:hypothetical protein
MPAAWKAVNSADTVDASVPQRSGSISQDAQPSNQFTDCGDPVQDLGGNGVGRLIVHISPYFIKVHRFPRALPI